MREHEQPRPLIIAVPTFGYDGGDPEIELFLEGFCQDLCDVLGTRDGVQAVPVFYRAESHDGEAVDRVVVRLTEAPEVDLLVSVCRDLGADFGILGTIAAEGQRLALAVQLHDHNGVALYHHQYRIHEHELQVTRSELAGEIWREIGLPAPGLVARLKARGTLDAQAYRQYCIAKRFEAEEEARTSALEGSLLRDPHYTEAALALAHSLVLRLQNDQATELLEDLVVAHPDDADVLLLLGTLLADAGDAVRARDILERAYEHGRRGLYACPLAFHLERMGDRERARTLLMQAVAEGVADDVVFVRLARILLDTGEPGQALDLCQRALLLAPDDPTIHASIAEALEQLGESQPARAFLSRAFELGSPDTEALHSMARLLAGDGRHREAISIAEAALERGGDDLGDLHLLRGTCYAQLNMRREAAEAFEAACLDPTHPAAAMAARALDHLDRMLELPLEPTADRIELLVEKGQASEALALAEELCELYPERWRPRYLLALCLRRLGREEQTLEAVHAALESSPYHLEVLHLLLRVCLERGNPEEALPLLLRASKARPAEPALWCHVALVYLHLERLDEAEEALARALEADPADETARWYRKLIRKRRRRQ